MPTVAALALDRILEAQSREATALCVAAPPPAKLERSTPRLSSEKKRIPPRPHVSPALYTTPESTPLPDSPSSFPPSPYIINHKRRGPRLLKTFSESDIFEHRTEPVEEQKAKGVALNKADEVALVKDEDVTNGFQSGENEASKLDDVLVENGESASPEGVLSAEREMECEEFFDPNDSVSVTSNTEIDDSSGPDRVCKPSTPMGEFYDAFEDISSEGAIQTSSQNIEAELREMRLNLLLEIETRKQAEETLENMQNQWQRLSEQLSLVGLTLSPPPTTLEGRDGELDIDPAEDLLQQVVLARVVAGSIGRACSRAEVELDMESRIESKNFEITRLLDRLHFYETTNREMSQRNLEAVEMARQIRHQRKRRQKWIWRSVGLVLTVGAAALAWSYLPVSTPPPPSDDGDGAGSHKVD